MNRDKQIFDLIMLIGSLSKDKQEKVFKFIDLLKQLEGLPVEQQQEIIDNIQDQGLLECIDIYKDSLS